MSLFDKLKTREIKDKQGRLVFQRWRLLKTPWFQVFIHKIHDRDRDYFLHDHPWSFISFILKGGYQEDYAPKDAPCSSLIQQIRTRKPFSCSFMKAAGEYHRIRKLLNGPCWTLVIASPAQRTWGYKTPSGWMDNITYREMKNNGMLGGLVVF